MTINITYDLPDEQREYELAMNGWGYYATIVAMDEWLRAQTKHEDLSTDKVDTIQECRERLYQIAYDHRIDIDS